MLASKVTPRHSKGKDISFATYDHCVSLDWSLLTMAIGHLSRLMQTPTVFERPANVRILKDYLQSLHGSIVLTFEETTTAQWLYLELKDTVDRIVICDPFRNHFLSDGSKTDKIDAAKLVLLLRGNLLREVFHTDDGLYDLRLLVSAYTDLVQDGVRTINRLKALERGHGDTTTHAAFILTHLQQSLALYKQAKGEYLLVFKRFCRRIKNLKLLIAVDGIDTISAVRILAIVVDARRFPRSGKYLNYCGLVHNAKFSGGRSYGRRKAHCCRALKAVYKTAALAALRGRSPVREYYEHLLHHGRSEDHARHEIARYIATVTYGILKTGTPYDPYRWRNSATVALRRAIAS